MTPRAVWKGFLKFGSVSCAIKLIGATSESEKLHFRILNRKNQLPVKSAYFDESTGKTVESDDIIKGYELDKGDYLHLEPDEIKAAKLSSEHTLDVDGFIDEKTIDPIYLDKPYYIVPADKVANEAYAVFREALRKKGVAARSCIVLYQRGREVVIQATGDGITMTTLRPHNEVVDAKSVFDDMRNIKIDPEMAEIASLIIEKKVTKFDPSGFEDTYENALIEMIKAKQQGKKPPKPAPRPKENVVNLADVLRKSLEKEGGKLPAKSKSAPRKKAS